METEILLLLDFLDNRELINRHDTGVNFFFFWTYKVSGKGISGEDTLRVK